jgi:hypothetical protein
LRGNFASRLADLLIERGTFKSVLLAPISVDGSRIEEWTTGGARHRRLQVAIARARASSPVRRLSHGGIRIDQARGTLVRGAEHGGSRLRRRQLTRRNAPMNGSAKKERPPTVSRSPVRIKAALTAYAALKPAYSAAMAKASTAPARKFRRASGSAGAHVANSFSSARNGPFVTSWMAANSDRTMTLCHIALLRR